jgi:ABC-2 type transport system permease protein
VKAFLAFTGKEFTEYIRTYKLFILLIVFMIFGFLSPITAKYLPQILEMAGLDPAAMGMGDPTAADSFAQFFKNVGQMGLLVVVIIFSGIMANEFTKGTLVNMLTKGLKRPTVILSKWASSILCWTAAYLLCLGITYGYTAFYFEIEGYQHMFASFFALWLYGVFLLVLVILGGTLFKNVYGSLLLTGGVAVVLTLLNLVPSFQTYNPASLASDSLALITAQKALDDLLPAFILCGASILILTAASILIFNKKQI